MSGVEIERKYIINMPNLEMIRRQEGHTESEIEQIYLSSANKETRRIRKRDFKGRIEYTETVKTPIDFMSSAELEREINAEEYELLKTDALPDRCPVCKVRHTFLFGEQLFEIDIYPQWKNTAVLETELRNRNCKVDFPPFIKIVREVTGDRSYSNAAMSKSFPDEDI